MGLDFDLKTFLVNLKATKPPYECPVKGCGRVYKRYMGIDAHLHNFDHDNPDNMRPATPQKKTPGSSRRSRKFFGFRKGSSTNRTPRKSPSPPPLPRSPVKETLPYAVEIDLDGQTHRLNIYEPLEIIPQDEIDNCDNTEKEERPDKASGKQVAKQGEVTKKEKPSGTSHPTLKLPEASFKVLDDYVKPPQAPERPTSYYRFIEKSNDELDEEIEYDMDEEDYAWLDLMNQKRKDDHYPPISQEVFELLMDRFEKEAFFQSQTVGKDLQPSIDEDAVCSICMDGECQNSNVILFCDMCNLAVHQECYGVPYIPEGQWLCRRCLQSPSRAVDCVLCPNKGGAFKQTDDSRWAHVVCALWIPEVGFANTVFLEPIDSMERIPAARWKLNCYICKQRSTGACIQCHKTNCYTAFHVTCAQQAGLYMKIEPVRETGANGLTINVRKTAFCDVHTPADMNFHPMIDNSVDDSVLQKVQKAKEESRLKMRKARKILAEKRNAVPVVSIPIIPPNRITRISSKVTMSGKKQFISRLVSYWTLKRQSRNGVPLLRRLQSCHMSRNKDESKNDKQSNALKEQLKYWQRLRQDLEKARLLVELIRKREKLKREQLRLCQLATEMELQPFVYLLKQTLEKLEVLDPQGIFAEPVSRTEVPDYYNVIKNPMDFKTMREKVESHTYKDIEEFDADFTTMIENCLLYNSKETMFYRAAVKLRDQGGAMIRAAKRMARRVGYDPETGLHTAEPPDLEEEPMILEDVDIFMPPDVRKSMSLEEQLKVLLDRLDMANASRHCKRSKLAKRIKTEIQKVRRQLALQKGFPYNTDDETRSIDTASEPSAASSREASPAGRDPDTLSDVQTPSPVRSPVHEQEPLTVKAKPGRPFARGRRRGRGRGRWRGRGRGASSGDRREGEEMNGPSEGESTEEEEDKAFSSHATESAEPKSQEDDDANLDTPNTPAGVNRRTSVLFRKKEPLRKTPQTDSSSAQPKRGRSARSRKASVEPEEEEKDLKVTQDSNQGNSKSTEHTHALSKRLDSPRSPLSPKSPGSPRKRSASINTGSFHRGEPLAKRSTLHPDPNGLFPTVQTTSFMQYRSFIPATSDTEDNTETETSDSSMDDDSSTQTSSSDEEGDENSRYSRRVRTKKRYAYEEDGEDVIPLEPLDLVWAKCRGYPWYPALIINPKMPKTGYFHNGVPIPVPPDDVLNLHRKYSDHVYLVLFFDAKRTWQWLPRAKLEPLGVDSGLDKNKLVENKKPNVRRAVEKAYQKAIMHRCSVTGEPNPLLPNEAPLSD